jgi:hypothetical protein
MITDRAQFFGRAAQIDDVFNRLNGTQPGSSNIVGPRRVGRSSFLWQIKTLAPERLIAPGQFVFAYIDLQREEIASPDLFRGYAMRALNGDAIANKLHPLDADSFSGRLTHLRNRGIHPVLLLDEFEVLIESDRKFPESFFSGLRALLNAHQLLCVIATQKPFGDYKLTHPVVSTLHGICLPIQPVFGALSEVEAHAMLAQPHEYPFTTAQIGMTLHYSSRHPLHLTVFADRLYQQRQHAGAQWTAADDKAVIAAYQADKTAITAAPMPKPTLSQRFVTAIGTVITWVEAHPKVVGGIVAVVVVAMLLISGVITLDQLVNATRDRIVGAPTPVGNPQPTATP